MSHLPERPKQSRQSDFSVLPCRRALLASVEAMKFQRTASAQWQRGRVLMCGLVTADTLCSFRMTRAVRCQLGLLPSSAYLRLSSRCTCRVLRCCMIDVVGLMWLSAEQPSLFSCVRFPLTGRRQYARFRHCTEHASPLIEARFVRCKRRSCILHTSLVAPHVFNVLIRFGIHRMATNSFEMCGYRRG